MNISKKKSRSARRKSPLKKSRSARRKSPVKKSRSTRRKSPSRRYHHKLHLRGGALVQCQNCKSYKNESDTNKIFNRITKTNEFKCKRVCAFRTERQAAIDNAAIAAQQEDNRQELIRQNALRLAANPEIAAARIDRQQAQEQAARDRQQAREEADRAREEADRARADAVRAREEVDAYRKSIIEAQKVIKEIKNRKRNLLTDRQFKQLSQPLYRNYGAARQADTNRWVQHTKDLRNTYINSWNHYNDSYDDSNPLWGHIDVTGEITDDIMNLIHKRRVHIDHHNRQTTRNINRKHYLALRNLYTTTSSLDQDNNFLMERNLISYSWDSINKNINIDESIPYQFSPNSIEIHCTTLKTKDNVRTITDARGNKIPSNFYGHVTLNVIGPITEKNQEDINRMGTEDYSNKIDTDNRTRYQCIEDIEKKLMGREFHYGIFIDPVNSKKTEKWWGKNQFGYYNMRNFDQEQFTTGDIKTTYFPTHNSPMRLMLEYYLNCINTCPEEIVFNPDPTRGQTKLTYKDLTGWGRPRKIIN